MRLATGLNSSICLAILLPARTLVNSMMVKSTISIRNSLKDTSLLANLVMPRTSMKGLAISKRTSPAASTAWRRNPFSTSKVPSLRAIVLPRDIPSHICLLAQFRCLSSKSEASLRTLSTPPVKNICREKWWKYLSSTQLWKVFAVKSPKKFEHLKLFSYLT